jgi:hypothetical protein
LKLPLRSLCAGALAAALPACGALFGVDFSDAHPRAADVDASLDGGPEASAGFCASETPRHAFCADFDESADPASGWTAAQRVNGAIARGTGFVSPPAALASQIGAPSADASTASAFLKGELAARASAVRYAFDFRVEDCTAVAGGFYVMAGVYVDSAFESLTSLSFDPNGLEVLFAEAAPTSDGGSAASVSSLGSFAANVWMHASVELALSSGSHYHVRIRRDDDAGAPRDLDRAGGALVSDGLITVQLGLNAIAPYEACRIELDNFTLDYDP